MPSVRFRSGEVELAGELHLPGSKSPYPTVVLLHGAGWGLRKFYQAHVEAFLRAGVASFVFDRRGEGESTGSAEQDIFAFAEDAVAAFEAARPLPGVDRSRLGLWGYSNGAWVASLAASRLPDCAFLVLAGASAVTPAASEVFRRSEDLRSQGIAPTTVEAVRRTWEIAMDYAGRGEWSDSWDAELPALRKTIESDPAIDVLPVPEFVRRNPALDSVPRFDSPLFANLKESAKGINPDMAFDPIPALRMVRCPVLTVLAEHDRNLPTAESVALFQKLAAERDTAGFRIEVLPGADHQFSPENTPDHSRQEWMTRPRTAAEFRSGYLELMAEWIAGVMG